jgi:hypothetical protein
VTDLSAGADRHRDTPVTPSKDWQTLLDGCDFDMASLEIRDMLDINQREAASRGEEVIVRNDLGNALQRFLGFPSMETAIPLLAVAPSLFSYFEGCKPGGHFYEMNVLRDTGEDLYSLPSKAAPTYDELLDRLVGLSADEPTPPVEVAKFLGRYGWKRGDPPSDYAPGTQRWCDPLATERWFVWQNAFDTQRERNRRGISAARETTCPSTSPAKDKKVAVFALLAVIVGIVSILVGATLVELAGAEIGLWIVWMIARA